MSAVRSVRASKLRPLLAAACLALLPRPAIGQCSPARGAAVGSLCLADGRFEIAVDWQDVRSSPRASGPGTPRALSDDSGYFWFFRDSNIELLSKVLDGRSITGRHWYFHAPLTDVEFLVEVLDHQTGFRYRYLNPTGSSTVVQDVQAFDDQPLDGRVLLVVAHPDDEGLFAPLLARLCVDRSQVCRLLVMTRGENGPCVLESGCGDDLGELRAQEMLASAALFDAQLVHWQLPDLGGTPEDVREGWEAAAGGSAALLSRLKREIDDFVPSTLLVFDPRHGSTCHPAHRSSADLTIAAAGQSELRPAIYRLTTVASFEPTGSGTGAGFGEPRIGDPAVLSFLGDWSRVAEVMSVHESQFTEELRDTVSNVPEEQRVVHLIAGELNASSDPTYELCEGGG